VWQHHIGVRCIVGQVGQRRIIELRIPSRQDRPKKSDLDEDFPIRLQKPIDTPYGPYADGFPAEQHLLGPFGPIRAKVKKLAAESQTAHAGEPDNGSSEGADR
jgi:hypothetical protein